MSEPRQGPITRATRPVHPERPCLNCGDPTHGEFCPKCGQRKVDVQVSLPVMVKEVLEDELMLSRRLPYTILALLFRPGFLTAEVLAGRVVRYVRPLRLYLMSSVVFFLLLSFVSLRAIERADFGDGDVEVDSVAQANMGIAVLDSTLAALDAQLEGPDVTAAQAIALSAVRSRMVSQREELLAARDSLGSEDRAQPGTDAEDEPERAARPRRNLDLETGVPRLDSVIRARTELWEEMENDEIAEDVVGTALRYVPTIIFLVLPLFAGVLKLLYVRQGRYYAEHVIFVLHAHAFVFLIFSLVILTRSWIGGLPLLLLLIWMFLYIYLAMRRVYGQSRFKTFLKYWTLGWMYFWILLAAIPLFVIARVLLLPA